MGDKGEGPLLVSGVMSLCSTLSANSRGSELRSDFVESLISSLEHMEAVGDVSSGHGEPDFKSLPPDLAVSSKSCSATSSTFFFGFHLKLLFHADLIFL